MTSLLRPQERLRTDPRSIDLAAHAPRSRWLVPLVLVALSTVAAVASTGFLEADEITHFLNSKQVWADWRSLLSIWGRLGCTAFYAPAAPFGLTAARLLAVALTASVALGTTLLLRHFLPRSRGATPLQRHATALVWLLLFAQPMFLLNSFTVMTEMLLAATWVWAAVILANARPRATRGILPAAFVLGLGGLMRPEGWLAVAAWPIAAWLWLSIEGRGFSPAPPRARRAVWVLFSTLLAGLPTLFWYLLGAWGLRSWTWVATYWPWAPESQYGTTGLLFLLSAAVSMGLWMWPLVAGGAWTFARAARQELQADMPPGQAPTRGREALLLLVAPLVGVFAVHGILGSFGLFGSMSLPRYFQCVAPMAAVLAVAAALRAEHRFRRSRWRQRLLRAAVLGMPAFTALALVATGYLPMWSLASTRRMDLVADELCQRVPPAERRDRLILAHPYLVHKLNLELGTKVDMRATSADAMAQAPAGTILVTHQNLWTKEGRWSGEQLQAWGYQREDAFAARMREIREWHPITFEPGALGEVHMWIKQPAADAP